MKKLSLLMVTIAVSVVSYAQQVNFDVSKAEIKWTGKKVTGEHWGYVTLMNGMIDLKGNKVNGGKFVIDMASISDKDLESEEWNAKLVGHLKSEDFFNVQKYPTTELVLNPGGVFIRNQAILSGKLTIKGITQPITFTAVKSTTGYTASITVDRTKYDIKYGSGKFFDSLGDKMIYDEFTLDVKLVL